MNNGMIIGKNKSHKKRNFVIGFIFIGLILALSAGFWFLGTKKSEEKNLTYVDRCSTEQSDEYQDIRVSINKDVTESWEDASKKIMTNGDYQRDPNCLLLLSYINYKLGDIELAQKNMESFDKLEKDEGEDKLFLSNLAEALVINSKTHKELLEFTQKNMETISNNVNFTN